MEGIKKREGETVLKKQSLLLNKAEPKIIFINFSLEIT